MYKHVHSYIHTHAIALTEDCIHTHSHTVDVCAHQQMRTTHTNPRKKRRSGGKQSVLPFPLCHQSSDEKTTTRNGSSSREWIEIDVILDVDGIEDEIIKAFHLSLQSKRRENHSESIINLKRQLFSSEEPLSVYLLLSIKQEKEILTLVLDSNTAEVSHSRRRMERTGYRLLEFQRTVMLQKQQQQWRE